MTTDRSDYDVLGQKNVALLRPGAVGLVGVLFLTVTAVAPIASMLLNVPVAVGFGNGIGAPASYVVATAVLLVFSIGYAAMARRVTAAGGFYSFISHGLGRELGMATGFGAVVAYSLAEAAMTGAFAYFGNLKIAELSGVNVPWPYLALTMVGLTGFLSYFDVRISTWILGLTLLAELAVLAIFDAAVFFSETANFRLAAINPVNAFKDFPAADGLAPGGFSIG